MSTAHSCNKRVAVGLLGCALLLASNRAAAQNPEKSRGARAEQLFQQAQALLDAGHVETACARFEASQALENSPDTLLNLGDCYQRAGRSASAWHSFLEAEAVARDQENSERAQVAAERIAALEPRLTRLVFVVPMTSHVPGLSVRLGANTVPPTAWGAPIPVDAGVQRVSASAEGYKAWSMEIDASHAEGRQLRVNVPTLAPNRSGQSSARGNAYRTAGAVTGGFGLAGLGAGAVFSAMSHNGSDAQACASSMVQCGPSTAHNSALADAAALSFAMGGALFATGVTLFVLAPSPDQKQENALRVAARYASSGGRVQLEGVW